MTEVVIIFMVQTHATRPAHTHSFIMQAPPNNLPRTKLGHHDTQKSSGVSHSGRREQRNTEEYMILGKIKIVRKSNLSEFPDDSRRDGVQWLAGCSSPSSSSSSSSRG